MTSRVRRLGVMWTVALTAAAVGTSLETPNFVAAAPETANLVAASGGNNLCHPGRSDSLEPAPSTYYFNGWAYQAGSPGLGGVTVSLNTYSAYVSKDTVYAWAMLADNDQSDRNLWNYAQVGYFEQPNTGPQFFVAWSGPGTNHVQHDYILGPVAVGSRHSYTVLWGNSQNLYTFLIDNKPVLLPEQASPNFPATEAIVSGETHNASSQMPGDVDNPLDMQSAGWVLKGSQNWRAFNATGHAFIRNGLTYDPIPRPSLTPNPPWYGDQVVSNNELKIWDWGCPQRATAFQDNTGHLWVYTGSGGTNTGQPMMHGTSPSNTRLSNGNYEVAFDSSTGHLTAYGPPGVNTTGLGIQPNTSPSIAGLGNGSYEAAFVALGTGDLYTYGPSMGNNATGLGIAGGTSPSITGLSNGSYEVAFQALGTGNLYTYGPTTGNNATGLGMAGGTSPIIVRLSNGSYEVAFQANSGALYTYGSTTGNDATGLPMAGGTHPTITALPNGSYEVAFQGTAGDLFTYGPTTGTVDTHQPMMAGTSPSIVSLRGTGGWEIAYQGSDTNLHTYVSSGWSTNTGLGMMGGTSPANAPPA
jgi:hypothetical protein